MPPVRTTVGSLALAALLLLAPTAAAQGDAYEVIWSEMRSEISAGGTLDAGAEKTLKVAVEQENLTGIEFLLTWVETGDEFRMTRSDTFRMSVQDPEGDSVGSPVEGATGLLSIETPRLHPIPRGATVHAGSPEEARQKLEADTSDEGTGTWRVTVALVDTGNPTGANVDTTNSYVLTVILHYYEAGVFRVVSLENPSSKGLLQSVDGEQAPWLYATFGLAGAAVLLGGFLVADRAGWLPSRRGK